MLTESGGHLRQWQKGARIEVHVHLLDLRLNFLLILKNALKNSLIISSINWCSKCRTPQTRERSTSTTTSRGLTMACLLRAHWSTSGVTSQHVRTTRRHLSFTAGAHYFWLMPSRVDKRNIKLEISNLILVHLRHNLGLGWDLAEWSERCACMPKIAGSNPISGNESTFCSDLLLTARCKSSWAPVVVTCLLCYPGITLCSQRQESPERAE
jgi:hypothetical protein